MQPTLPTVFKRFELQLLVGRRHGSGGLRRRRVVDHWIPRGYTADDELDRAQRAAAEVAACGGCACASIIPLVHYTVKPPFPVCSGHFPAL